MLNNSSNNETYSENFLFRKRTHVILPDGVKTHQKSFFNSSESTIKYEQLGSIIQYQSQLKLTEIITSAVFIILGVKGFMKSTTDDVLFAISVILIAIAFYWLISILFSLKHIGSYYFSDRIKKNENTLEIKSRYPASIELDQFLNEILRRKKNSEISYLVDSLSKELSEIEIKQETSYLKRKYLLSEQEYRTILNQIRHKQSTDDNNK